MRYYLTSNITFDREETLKREKIVIENTQPVKDNFFKRQIILQNGKIFTDKDKRIITVLNNFLATNVTVKRIIGLSLFILLSFLLLFFYIKKFAANIFRTNEAYLVLFFDFIVFLVVMLFINFLIGTSSSSFLSFYALPFSFFTIVIILFLDTNLAIYASLILSIIASFFFGYGIDVLLYGIVNSAFTIYFTKDIFKRTTLFFNFLLFGFLSISVPILFGLMKGFPGGIIFYNSISVIIGNLLSYILLISFVPLFESIFDITTTFQMIELLSGEHPALKNLTLVAPGTYQHSVAVGNLSEPAALEIDANPIIAKLGAHFHDIGKVKTPNYFIENQFNGKNPHDKIGPLISAKYLRQHVTYGYELSLEYMLPKPVRKIILEHHGTTFMKYFYKKAKDMFDDGKIKELDENEFRYQGNKPTFKESAIVMFADRVEAQSRILKNYRYSTIKNMVMDTLNKLLIEEEQFSNCPITLQELYKVANSFIKTIQTMYHKRIEYEKQNKS
jgi:putative nucleotidyltransferase with HDIG domain